MRLWPFTAEPEAVANYGPLETADGTACFEIESLRSAKDGFVVRLKGVADRSTAERLRNIELYVPRSRLPDPEPDEFYHADLIDLAAIDANGGALGTVVAVHNFGAGDILEIAPSGGDTFMIPFTAAAVPVVEHPGGANRRRTCRRTPMPATPPRLRRSPVAFRAERNKPAGNACGARRC